MPRGEGGCDCVLCQGEREDVTVYYAKGRGGCDCVLCQGERGICSMAKVLVRLSGKTNYSPKLPGASSEGVRFGREGTHRTQICISNHTVNTLILILSKYVQYYNYVP